KAARTHTGIGRKAASVGLAAVERARAALGSLEGRVVLVVGAGDTGELVARTLMKQGAGELLVANRTPERATAVAERCGGRSVDFARLGDACARADIVITCTAAPRPILSRDLLAAALAARPERPIFIVDVAIPRDV